MDWQREGRCARSVIPPPGYPQAHLPPVLVHGSSQGVAGATGDDAHRRLHSLFPVRAIQESIQHLAGRKPDPWLLLLASTVPPRARGPGPPSHLIQQPISRDCDDAVPLAQAQSLDQLPSVVLSF